MEMGVNEPSSLELTPPASPSPTFGTPFQVDSRSTPRLFFDDDAEPEEERPVVVSPMIENLLTAEKGKRKREFSADFLANYRNSCKKSYKSRHEEEGAETESIPSTRPTTSSSSTVGNSYSPPNGSRTSSVEKGTTVPPSPDIGEQQEQGPSFTRKRAIPGEAWAAFPFRFCCSLSRTGFTQEEYLRSLLDDDPSWSQRGAGTSVVIRGMTWDRGRVFQDPDELCGFIQSGIHEILSSRNDVPNGMYQDSLSAMAFLHSTVRCVCGEEFNEDGKVWRFLKDVVRNLGSFLLVFHNWDKLLHPYHFSQPSSGPQKERNALYRGHMFLEVVWSCVKCSLCIENFSGRISEKLNVVDVVCQGSFDSLLQESVFLVISFLCRVTAAWNREFRGCPSPCRCLKELWGMTFLLMKRKQESFKLDFWHTIQVSVDSWLYPKDPNERRNEIYVPYRLESGSSESLCLCLEFLLLVCQILEEEVSGASERVLDERNEDLLKRLLHYSLTLEKPGGEWDGRLRRWLPLFRGLSPYSTSKWRLGVMEHFWKILADGLTAPLPGSAGTLGVSVPVVWRTCGEWVERGMDYRETTEKTSWRTWDHFLHLIVTYCRECGGGLEWDTIRRRAMGKMTGKVLVDMSPTALHDSLTLFIVLALEAKDLSKLLGHVKRVIEKLLSLERGEEREIEKMKMAWRFLGSLILVCGRGEHDCSEMSFLLSGSVSTALDFHERHKTDRLLANHLTGLFREFLSVLGHMIPPGRTSCNGIHGLLEVPFQSLVMIFPRNSGSLSDVVKFGTDMIEKLLEESGNLARMVPVASVLQKRLAPAILKLWSAGILTELCGECLGKLTQLESELPQPDYRLILDTLRSGGRCVPVESWRRLLFLLVSTETGIWKTKEFHWLMIRSWYRCCLLDTEDSGDMLEVTRWIFGLKCMEESVPEESLVPSRSGSESCQTLFRALADTASRTNNLELLKSNMEEWFGNTLSVLSEQTSDRAKVMRSYEIVGQMVKYCSKLIYVKPAAFGTKNESLLNQILRLILKEGAAGVRNSLPSILLGILSLPWTEDSYLRRKLKEIFQEFASRNWAGRAGHPLVKSLTRPAESMSRVRLRRLFVEEAFPEKIRALHRCGGEGEKKDLAQRQEAAKNLWHFYEQVITDSETRWEDVMSDIKVVFTSGLWSLSEKYCSDSVMGACRSVLRRLLHRAVQHNSLNSLLDSVDSINQEEIQGILAAAGFDQFYSALKTICDCLENSSLRRVFVSKVWTVAENRENRAGRGSGKLRSNQLEKLKRLMTVENQ